MSSTEQTTGHIALPPSKHPTKHVERVGRWRWLWTAVDEASGEVLKSGHRPTDQWARRKADAVANRIHDERLEAER